MMMKRNLLCTVLACTFFCLIAAQAFADDVCPNDMVMVTDTSGQQTCMPASAMSDFTSDTLSNTEDHEEYAKYQKTKLIHESMLDSGISLELGFGYSFDAAALAQLNFEYQFDASTNDTLSFGINTKFDFRAGESPYLGLDWSLGPAIHFNWGSFRTTAAMGFGIFYVAKYDKYSSTEKEVFFAIRPELKFDFFLIRKLWIGFGVDIPLFFSPKAFPWFNTDLHVGYKF